MVDIWVDVDTAIAEAPINILALTDDTDFKTREESVTYDQAGMDLVWNFVTTAGAFTQTAVTPTTAGDYDWASQTNGMYSIEIPASGGASINNDTEGYGWFTGFATGVLPWRGPIIGFRAAALNNALIDGGDTLDVNLETIKTQTVTAAAGVTINPSVGAATIVPTNTQFEARSLPNADYTIVADLGTVQTADHTAGIADIPTVAEFNARTILAADYTIVADLGVIQTGDSFAIVNSGTFGNAQLVRSTTPVNTLDVAATGEVGLDFDNIKNATAPHTLTNITVPVVTLTDTVTTYTGNTPQTADNNTILANATYGNAAIRTRGDVAWITGGGGGITDILNVQPIIPNDIDLADTAIVRLALGLTNMIDDLPSAVEITPGTISIDRKAIGGTSWVSIVSDSACSESAGLVYYDEVFNATTNYAEGDSIRITFKNQLITVLANDYEITDSTGWIFQTSIRQTMRGTNSANTTIPDVAGTAAGLHATTDGKVDVVDGIVDIIAVDVAGLNGDAMRGTDGANTTVPDAAGVVPTAVENRQEMDSNSTQLAAILLYTGTTIPDLIGALNDLAAAEVWDLASAITLDFGTLMERVYEILQNRANITDATGVSTLRNIGNTANLATWTITDDDTTTLRTEAVWV